MTPFATFALLYMTALFLELAEKWRYPLFTLAVLLLVVLFLRIGITRVTFLIFLAVTSAHFLLLQFPDVANHVNIAIYCNLLLGLGIGYSLLRRRLFPDDGDAFELVRPVLQASMILVYVLAGFHKLNSDFLDPVVSCAGDLAADLSRLTRPGRIGIPPAPVLLGAILFGAERLLRHRLERPARLALIGAAIVAAVIALLLAPRLPAGVLTASVLGLALVVIAWELVGGALLAVPRLQAAILAFSWIMHASLALIGFVDFGALALALLFTFVPRPYQDLMSIRLRAPILGHSMSRAHAYVALCVLSGIASGVGRRLIAGVLFNAAALVLLWPVLTALVTRSGSPWSGVAPRSRVTPGWMFAFPLVLLLHGFTSYLGLRTAGNFSMFSNLRTEGPRSNHFLLGGNQIKLWGYQEDVVRFLHIDDRLARIGYQYQPLEGNELPVVEFRKLIHQWTRAGATIPMTFEYRDEVHTTEDIVSEPAWRTGGRDWEMRLLDFRVIQPEGPNRCRW